MTLDEYIEREGRGAMRILAKKTRISRQVLTAIRKRGWAWDLQAEAIEKATNGEVTAASLDRDAE